MYNTNIQILSGDFSRSPEAQARRDAKRKAPRIKEGHKPEVSILSAIRDEANSRSSEVKAREKIQAKYNSLNIAPAKPSYGMKPYTGHSPRIIEPGNLPYRESYSGVAHKIRRSTFSPDIQQTDRRLEREFRESQIKKSKPSPDYLKGLKPYKGEYVRRIQPSKTPNPVAPPKPQPKSTKSKIASPNFTVSPKTSSMVNPKALAVANSKTRGLSKKAKIGIGVGVGAAATGAGIYAYKKYKKKKEKELEDLKRQQELEAPRQGYTPYPTPQTRTTYAVPTGDYSESSDLANKIWAANAKARFDKKSFRKGALAGAGVGAVATAGIGAGVYAYKKRQAQKKELEQNNINSRVPSGDYSEEN